MDMTKTTTPIRKWLMEKYFAWQLDQGEPKPELEFAKHIGVSQATMNKWMNGTRTPTGLYLERLAEKFGTLK